MLLNVLDQSRSSFSVHPDLELDSDKRSRLSSTQGEKPVNFLPSYLFKIDDILRAGKEFCVHEVEDVSNSIITHS